MKAVINNIVLYAHCPQYAWSVNKADKLDKK